MANSATQPRILFVTPEVAFVPARTGNRTHFLGACSGCFSGLAAELINGLLNLGVDVHVAQPHYRKLFEMVSCNQQANPSIKLPIDRVHLAEDCSFFYSDSLHLKYEWKNIEISLNFQREVINQIAPRVQPDLIHCHDWMTGLIPAAAKQYEISCLFSVLNADSAKSLLSDVEERGIDAAAFWRYLYYDRFPGDYEDTRDTNHLDLLLSGILAASYVEISNFMLLPNAASGDSQASYTCLRKVLAEKSNAGCAGTIAATPAPLINTDSDKKRYYNSGPAQQHAGERKNERVVTRIAPWFYHWEMTYRYLDLYESILQWPLVAPKPKKAPAITKNSHARIPDGQAIPYQKTRSTQSDRIPNERIPPPAMAPI